MTLSAPITSHALTAPTADDVRASLRAATGSRFDEVWQQVCRTASLSPSCDDLDEPELMALVTAVRELPGRAGLAGIDVGVRAAAHRALARERDAGPAVAPGALLASAASTTLGSPRAVTEMLLQGAPSSARLDEVVALDLFAPGTRQILDTAMKEAARAAGVGVGLVSIVLDQSQVFAGSYGLSGWLEQAGGTPVEWSFCTTAVRTEQPYLVPDAARDVLQRSNPLVVHDGVGSYLGVPLITSSGQVLGACCLIDSSARTYTAGELARLVATAAELVATLERLRPQQPPHR